MIHGQGVATLATHGPVQMIFMLGPRSNAPAQLFVVRGQLMLTRLNDAHGSGWLVGILVALEDLVQFRFDAVELLIVGHNLPH